MNEHLAERPSRSIRPATPDPITGDVERLTPTQLRVLQGVHRGLANKQIAFNLGIAEATVKAHMTALMRKLNVRNRTQVAILAEKIAGTEIYPADERQILAVN